MYLGVYVDFLSVVTRIPLYFYPISNLPILRFPLRRWVNHPMSGSCARSWLMGTSNNWPLTLCLKSSRIEKTNMGIFGHTNGPNSQFGGENSDFGDPIKLEWGRYGRYRLPNDCPLRKVLKIATSNTSTIGQKTHTKPIKNRNLLWKKIISTIHFQLYHAFIAFHQISPPGHLGSLSLWKIQIRVLIKGHPCRWIPCNRYWIEKPNAGTPW